MLFVALAHKGVDVSWISAMINKETVVSPVAPQTETGLKGALRPPRQHWSTVTEPVAPTAEGFSDSTTFPIV